MDAVVKELLDKETLDTTEFMAMVNDLGVKGDVAAADLGVKEGEVAAASR